MSASIGDDWLWLSWTNPSDADFTGVMVRRLEGATAPTLTSGTLVTDFNDQADYVVDPGLTPGTQYSYAFFAHDGANNYAAAANVTGWTTGPRRTTPRPGRSPPPDRHRGQRYLDQAGLGQPGRHRLHRGDDPPREGRNGALDSRRRHHEVLTTATDTGLTLGTVYSYALFAHDGANNYAAAVDVTAGTAQTAARGRPAPMGAGP